MQLHDIWETGETVPVIAKLLVIATDRPERCTMNCVLYHNGNSTMRCLYAALIDPSKLRSCPRCLRKRLNSLINDSISILHQSISNDQNRCTNCADWDYNRGSVLRIECPYSYPCQEHNKRPPPTGRSVGIRKIQPVSMSYTYLKQVCEYCFHNVFMGMCSKREALTYMKVLGVKDSYTKQYVIDKAYKLRTTNPTNYDCLLELHYPSLWTSVIFMQQCIDTPMQKIFQGMIKSLMDLISDWLKSQQIFSKFCDKSIDYMSNIKDMHLDWCKMEPFIYGKTGVGTGGWVAEQYVEYSRLLLVIYSHVEVLEDHNKIDVTPLRCFVQSAFLCVCYLMASIDVDTSYIDAHVKIFLRCSHKFSDDKTHPWWKRGNILSLLNLKGQIDMFGPLRLYWEGNRERYIQTIKPLLHNMRTTNTYLDKKLQQLHSNIGLREILTKADLPGKFNDKCLYARTKPMVSYTSHDEILQLINYRVPISGVIITNEEGYDKTYISSKRDSDKVYLYTVKWGMT